MLFKRGYSIDNIRKYVVGVDKKVMICNGKRVDYINFDNAASTPTLQPVVDKVNSFLEWYSSIHRGTGYKSRLSTKIYDEAHEIVASFVGSSSENTVIFVKNTTEAINKISYRLGLSKDDIVITSIMEHHSNDLPWRDKAKVFHLKVLDNGELDILDLEHKLRTYNGRVKLVAITGCSNVTGIVTDIHYIAELCHKHGSRVLVDGAQLTPHRKVNMKGNNKNNYIDFFVFSGHKMYAPFGTGVLIGPMSVFKKGVPEYVGGGTILSVTEHNSHWATPPEKEEAGTPNVVGAVALSEAIKILQEIGMTNIQKHEKDLTSCLIEELNSLSNINIYSPLGTSSSIDTVGVISFNIQDIPHNLVAAVLSYEGGIGVRNGCFCAHPYIHKLLKLSPKEIVDVQTRLLLEDMSQIPGMVRVSFGVYNTINEIQSFKNTLKYISNNRLKILDEYILDSKTGEYLPRYLPKNSFNEFTL